MHDPQAAAEAAANPAPTIAPAPEAETEEEAAERQAEFEQRRAEHEEEQQHREEERKQQFEREQEEHEAEQTHRDELRNSREATFERIVANAPVAFTPAQLRVLLRAIVNLDPYTFTDDLADDLAGENENEQRTAEEVLLSAIDTLTEDNLTGFAIRLVLTGHRGIPRDSEFDFLAEAESVFITLIRKQSPRKRRSSLPLRQLQNRCRRRKARSRNHRKRTSQRRCKAEASTRGSRAFQRAGPVLPPHPSPVEIRRRRSEAVTKRTGTIAVNGAYPDFGAPFGGYKQGGIGREFGSEGIGHYIEHKAVAL